jgi:gliding motility-associated-like protein
MFKYYILFLFLLITHAGLFGQITSPEAIYGEATAYPSGSANDTIFYYSNIQAASLSLTPGGAGPYTFNWYRYNTSTNSFDIPVSTETGTSSSISALMETGYKVTYDDGAGTSGSYICWTLEPQVISAEIDMISEDCFVLELNAKDTVKALSYFDPSSGAAVPVDYGLTYTWASEPEGPDEDNPVSGETDKQIRIDAPVEDSEISVTVGSKFGLTQGASMHYTALAVKAEFRMEPESRGIPNEMDTTKKHSAPLVVRFFGEESKGNNLAYEWDFGGDGRAFEMNPLHTYQLAGTYQNILHVVNEVSGCDDTSEPQEIIVYESDLQVPNVFTPNGDGVNDEFRVAYRSIKTYRIDIFNRWGRKVYSSTNPALGWDGRIGKGEAAPGVYFYVIEAEGFIKEERYKLHGTITLIRGK